MISLKREKESSRCGLEKAVVTGQPGLEGPSRGWRTPVLLSWRNVCVCVCVRARVCTAVVKAAAGGTLRAPVLCSPADNRHSIHVC